MTSLITTDGLTTHFGSLAALADLDVDLHPGVVGLIGANGAGKSTTIKICLGLLPASTGRATVLAVGGGGGHKDGRGPAVTERVVGRGAEPRKADRPGGPIRTGVVTVTGVCPRTSSVRPTRGAD